MIDETPSGLAVNSRCDFEAKRRDARRQVDEAHTALACSRNLEPSAVEIHSLSGADYRLEIRSGIIDRQLQQTQPVLLIFDDDPDPFVQGLLKASRQLDSLDYALEESDHAQRQSHQAKFPPGWVGTFGEIGIANLAELVEYARKNLQGLKVLGFTEASQLRTAASAIRNIDKALAYWCIDDRPVPFPSPTTLEGAERFLLLQCQWLDARIASIESKTHIDSHIKHHGGAAGLHDAAIATEQSRLGETALLPNEPTFNSPAGFLGGSDLAKALRVHPAREEAFLKQLSRQKHTLGDGNWQEVQNRRRNNPQFQFKVDAPAIIELAERYQQPKSD